MDRAGRAALLGSMRLLWQAGTVTGMSDAQLLERAADGGPAAELAFAALVERHGPMVLRVCRRILRDPHDAHDAFQATFLVLARRARSIRDPRALASWLHGVALRAARGLRAAEVRRRHHERRAAGASCPVKSGEPRDPDLGAILHEELTRLPERFRAAVVLCDLEGLTHEQAAGRLACPVGTVKSRLVVARERLRRRLARRGLAPGAGAVAALVAAESAGAAVSIPLLDSTVHAATAVAAGRVADAAGAVPAAVVALSKRVLCAMILSKLKVAVAAGAVVVLAGAALAQAPASGEADAGPGRDRLERLEQKLDRLLRAIEGPRSPVVAQELPLNIAPRADPAGRLPGRGQHAPRNDPPPDGSGLPTYPPYSDGGPAAPAALEQRLERLERRVERLEELVARGAAPQSAEAAKSANPNARRN